jgi:DNA-binding transcriptional LysR family regulator
MRDLNELSIFTAIVDEMSFTRAADVLEISKAAVSKAIARMESRLGARLFERSTRRLRLTEAGEIYLGYSRRALEEANDGEAAITKLNEKPRGTLRVVMPVTLAQVSLAPQLARFLRRHPELRLEIFLGGGQIDPVAQRVDVAFQTAKPTADSQVIQKRMLRVQMGIYASPNYLRSAPSLRSPQDLLQHSCLALTATREGASWRLQKHGGKVQEVRVRGRIAIGDPVIHLRLCLDGVGVAILPHWLADDHMRKQQIVRVLSDWTPSPIELYVLYPTRLSMTPKLKAFLDFMGGVVPKP